MDTKKRIARARARSMMGDRCWFCGHPGATSREVVKGHLTWLCHRCDRVADRVSELSPLAELEAPPAPTEGPPKTGLDYLREIAWRMGRASRARHATCEEGA